MGNYAAENHFVNLVTIVFLRCCSYEVVLDILYRKVTRVYYNLKIESHEYGSYFQLHKITLQR